MEEHHYPVVHFENENKNTESLITSEQSNKSDQSGVTKQRGLTDNICGPSTKIGSQGSGPLNTENKPRSISGALDTEITQEQDTDLLNDIPVSKIGTYSKLDTVSAIEESKSKKDIQIVTKSNQLLPPLTIETKFEHKDLNVQANSRSTHNRSQKPNSTSKDFFKKRISIKKISSIFQALGKKSSKNASEKQNQSELPTNKNRRQGDPKADVEILYACSTTKFGNTTAKVKMRQRSAKVSFGDMFGFSKNLCEVDNKKTKFRKDKRNNEQYSSKAGECETSLRGDDNTDVPASLMQQINATIPECISCLSATNANVVHHIYSAIPQSSENLNIEKLPHPECHACIPNDDTIKMNTIDVAKKKSSRLWFPYDRRRTRLKSNKSKSTVQTRMVNPPAEKKNKRFRNRAALPRSNQEPKGKREKSTTNSDSQIHTRFSQKQIESLLKLNKRDHENLAVSPICNVLNVESGYRPRRIRKTKYPSHMTSIVYPMQEKIQFKAPAPHTRKTLQRPDRTSSDLSSLPTDQQYTNEREMNALLSGGNICDTKFDHGDKTSASNIRTTSVRKNITQDLISSSNPTNHTALKTVEKHKKKRSKSCLPPIINKLEQDNLNISKTIAPPTLKNRFSKIVKRRPKAINSTDQISNQLEVKAITKQLPKNKFSKDAKNYHSKKHYSSSDNIYTEPCSESIKGVHGIKNVQNTASPLNKFKKSTILRFSLPENNICGTVINNLNCDKNKSINQKPKKSKITTLKYRNKDKSNERMIENKRDQKMYVLKKTQQKRKRAVPGPIYIQRKTEPCVSDKEERDLKDNSNTSKCMLSSFKYNIRNFFDVKQPQKDFEKHTATKEESHFKHGGATKYVQKKKSFETQLTDMHLRTVNIAGVNKKSNYGTQRLRQSSVKTNNNEKPETLKYMQIKDKTSLSKLLVRDLNGEFTRKTKMGVAKDEKRILRYRTSKVCIIDGTKSQSNVTDVDKKKTTIHDGATKYVQKKKSYETHLTDMQLRTVNIAGVNKKSNYGTQRLRQTLVKRNSNKKPETLKYMQIKDKTSHSKLLVGGLNGEFTRKTKMGVAKDDKRILRYRTSKVCTIDGTKSQSNVTDVDKKKTTNSHSTVKYVPRKNRFTDIGLRVKSERDTEYSNNLFKQTGSHSTVKYVLGKNKITDSGLTGKSAGDAKGNSEILKDKIKTEIQRQGDNIQEKHIKGKSFVQKYQLIDKLQNKEYHKLPGKTQVISDTCVKITNLQKIKKLFSFNRRKKDETKKKKDLNLIILPSIGDTRFIKIDKEVQIHGPVICARSTSYERPEMITHNYENVKKTRKIQNIQGKYGKINWKALKRQDKTIAKCSPQKKKKSSIVHYSQKKNALCPNKNISKTKPWHVESQNEKYKIVKVTSSTNLPKHSLQKKYKYIQRKSKLNIGGPTLKKYRKWNKPRKTVKSILTTHCIDSKSSFPKKKACEFMNKSIKNIKKDINKHAKCKKTKTNKDSLISLRSTTNECGEREISISGRTKLVHNILKFISGGPAKLQKKYNNSTTVTLKTVEDKKNTHLHQSQNIQVCETPEKIQKILENINVASPVTNESAVKEVLRCSGSFTCETIPNSVIMPVARGQKEIKISGPPKEVKKLLKMICKAKKTSRSDPLNKVSISLPDSNRVEVCGHKKEVGKIIQLLHCNKKKKQNDSQCKKTCHSANFTWPFPGSKKTFMSGNAQDVKKVLKTLARVHRQCPYRSKTRSPITLSQQKKEKFKYLTLKINGSQEVQFCGPEEELKEIKKDIALSKTLKKNIDKRRKELKKQKCQEIAKKIKKLKNGKEIITVPIPGVKGITVTGTRAKVNKVLKDLPDADQLKHIRGLGCESSSNKIACGSVKAIKSTLKEVACEACPFKTTRGYERTEICLPVQKASVLSACTQLSSNMLADSDSFHVEAVQEVKSPAIQEKRLNKPNTSIQLYVASTENRKPQIFIQPSDIKTTKNKKKFNLCITAKISNKGRIECKKICIPAEEITSVAAKKGSPAFTKVCVKPRHLQKLKKLDFCNPRICLDSEDKTKKRLMSGDVCMETTGPPRVNQFHQNTWTKMRANKLTRCQYRYGKAPPVYVGNFSPKATFLDLCGNCGHMCVLCATGCLWLPLICCYKVYCCINS